MNRKRRSSNNTIFRNIRTKLRQAEHSRDVSYLLVFTFLYKYCSDSLKDYFLSVIEDKEITLDEAFRNPMYREAFRNDAFHMFGYYINDPEAYIDEVINTKYPERFFLSAFYKAFSENMEFVPNSNYEKYFRFIFNTFKRQIDFAKLEYDSEHNLLYKDLIYSISKLDIYEERFPFHEVFDQICQFRAINIDHDPDYITNILTELVCASKSSPMDVYNPFLNDGSSLIRLADKFPVTYGKSYGKGYDRITYCASIVRLLMSHFDLDSVFLEYGNAVDSVDINGASYDVIMSKLPHVGGWSSKRINKTQNREYAKLYRRRKLENVISSNFKMDEKSFADDSQFNEALDVLLEMMDDEFDSQTQFSGEYESLKDSEYLFLINLINSLKKDGVMIVSLSQSFLFKNSLETLRKYLTYENNFIDTIISLPDELGRYSRPEIICVFKKDKADDNVLFIDLSQGFNAKRVPNAPPGMVRRNLMLDDKTVNKLVRTYAKKEIINRYSNVVKVSDIVRNDFNLSVSRYVDTFEGEFIQLRDLAHEKQEITSNIKELNKKIDKMMQDLDIKF